jgi:hypothetical protein
MSDPAPTPSALEKALLQTPVLDALCVDDMNNIRDLLLGRIGTANQRSAILRIVIQLRNPNRILPKILREFPNSYPCHESRLGFTPRTIDPVPLENFASNPL